VTPNRIGQASHRPASPLNAGRQFGSASWAPVPLGGGARLASKSIKAETAKAL
jgi:hypothetical protein